MKKVKIAILLLLCTVVWCQTCPGPSQTNFTNSTVWSFSYDMFSNTTYINQVGDMKGFTTITGYTDYPEYMITFYGSGSIFAFPGVLYEYFQNSGYSNLSFSAGYIITYNGTDNLTIYSGIVPNVYLLANFTFLSGTGCMGLSYKQNMSTFVGVCSQTGIVIPSNFNMTCSSYNSSCYPCDCNCSSCFGPGPATCQGCSNGVLYSIYNNYFYVCGYCTTGLYQQPFYSNPNSRQCLSYCPGGYFLNKSTLMCSACDPACTTCYAPGYNSSCGSCTVGFYGYQYPNQVYFSCLQSCPPNTAIYSGSSQCGNCDPICSTCSVPSNNQNCTGCNFPYYLQPSSGQCLQTCPYGYYANKTTLKCIACDPSCSACNGSGPDACSGCNKNYYLQPSATSCRSYCPMGYNPKLGPNICLPCDSRCSACNGFLSTDCIACNPGYFLQPLTSGTSSCITSCPAGYYPDPNSNQCSPCDPTCAVCGDSTTTNCTSCSSGYYLQPGSSSCSDSCPTGYWTDDTTHTCEQCHQACASCTGPTKNECQSCHSGYYLQYSSTRCLKGCSTVGYWPDPSTNTCIPCSIECKKCSGPYNTQCASCVSGYFLQPQSTTCSYLCATGYYPDSQTNVCYPCSTGCATCTGSTNSVCSQCIVGYYFQPSSTQCSTSCPVEYYGDNSTRTCRECNAACTACSDGTATACSSCSLGYYLQPNSTACNDSCPSDYIANPVGTCDPFSNATTGTYIQSSRDAFWNAWSFWTPFGYVFWLCLTLVLIKTVCYKACLVQKLKAHSTDSSDKEPHAIKKYLVAFAVMHPLISIYVYKDPLVGKIYRSMLFFVRSMSVMAFSAVFITVDQSLSTFNLQMKHFDVKLFLIPFVVVLPIHGILERIIRSCKQGQKTYIKKQSEGILSSISLSLRKAFQMGFMLIMVLAGMVVVFALSEHFNYPQQISWAACFLKLSLQDLFLYPFVAYVWNCLVINCVIFNKKAPKCLNLLCKLLTDEGMLNALETLRKKSSRGKKTLDPAISGARLISISNPTEEIDIKEGKTKERGKPQKNVQSEDRGDDDEAIIYTTPQKKRGAEEGIIDLENNEEEIQVINYRPGSSDGFSKISEEGAILQELSVFKDRESAQKLIPVKEGSINQEYGIATAENESNQILGRGSEEAEHKEEGEEGKEGEEGEEGEEEESEEKGEEGNEQEGKERREEEVKGIKVELKAWEKVNERGEEKVDKKVDEKVDEKVKVSKEEEDKKDNQNKQEEMHEVIEKEEEYEEAEEEEEYEEGEEEEEEEEEEEYDEEEESKGNE